MKTKVEDQELQLHRINNRLKHYKKIPPAVFRIAKQVFLSVDDDNNKAGASTPTGRKKGTLWDAGEATIVNSNATASQSRSKSPKRDVLKEAEIANQVAQESSSLGLRSLKNGADQSTLDHKHR